MQDYDHKLDWYYEGQISKKLVSYLLTKGYKILKDNSHNISKKGEDIIASVDDNIEVIEVKGYPTSFYTNGINKGRSKKTNPKHQAKHWFSEALLSCIFNYKKHKENKYLTLSIALPYFYRYEELTDSVTDYFTDQKISLRLYFITEDGEVLISNLNKNLR